MQVSFVPTIEDEKQPVGFRPGATKENSASRLYVVSLGLGWWEVYECRVLRFVGLVFCWYSWIESFGGGVLDLSGEFC